MIRFTAKPKWPKRPDLAAQGPSQGWGRCDVDALSMQCQHLHKGQEQENCRVLPCRGGRDDGHKGVLGTLQRSDLMLCD